MKRINSRFDTEKAIKELNVNAGNKSVGLCARYVRKAIEAGGISTQGRPNSAKNYNDFLPKIGFCIVDKNGYIPIMGDIVVLQNTGSTSIHGHIAMYNGEIWISDFKQRDFWGGSGYRNKAEYDFFRSY